jgi:hypothetical protein
MTEQGKSIASFTNEIHPQKETSSAGDDDDEGYRSKSNTKKLSDEAGMNRFIWDLMYPEVKNPPNRVLGSSGGTINGPKVVPGKYKVKLTVGDQSMTQSFVVKLDPRIEASQADLQAEFDLLSQIHAKQNRTAKAVNKILAAKKQINNYLDKLADYPQIKKIKSTAQPILDSLQAVENELYQPDIHNSEDDLNYPVKLWIKLASLNTYVRSAYARPPKQSYELYDSLSTAVDQQLDRLKPILDQQVPQFNQMIRDMNIPALYLEESKE